MLIIALMSCKSKIWWP